MSNITHQVKMLKTIVGYDDVTGERKRNHYENGKVYTVSDHFLRDLIKAGAVELAEIDSIAKAETRETKPLDLSAMEKKELAAYAKEMKIKTKGMSDDEIRTAVANHQAASAEAA